MVIYLSMCGLACECPAFPIGALTTPNAARRESSFGGFFSDPGIFVHRLTCRWKCLLIRIECLHPSPQNCLSNPNLSWYSIKVCLVWLSQRTQDWRHYKSWDVLLNHSGDWEPKIKGLLPTEGLLATSLRSRQGSAQRKHSEDY